MSNCIFCDIAAGKMDTEILYEDKNIVAFADANPQAPVHILVIPRKHIESIKDIEKDEFDLVGEIHRVIVKLAEEHDIAGSGFRIVNNCGNEGGQTVDHLHFHLLGGRALSWPPG